LRSGNWGSTIIANSNASGFYNYWFYLCNQDLVLYAYSYDIQSAIATDVITTNNSWYHIAFTATRGGDAKIFVNGVNVANGTASSDFWYVGSVTIGDLRPGRNLRFNGTIDEVKIYPRALSASEILCRYGNNCTWNDTVILNASYNYYTTRASGGENYTTSSLMLPFQVYPNVSFAVSLPDDSKAYSSTIGSLTSDEEVNASVSTIANVSPCVRGTANCQTTLVANFRINNTGNVDENITMCLNQSINSKITVFGTLTNNSFSSPTVIPNCSYSVWKANQSLPVGTVDEFWIWANFTEVTIYDFAVSELFINSTEAV